MIVVMIILVIVLIVVGSKIRNYMVQISWNIDNDIIDNKQIERNIYQILRLQKYKHVFNTQESDGI